MSKFIDMVIHEKLVVFKRKRVELEREMEKYSIKSMVHMNIS